MRRSLFVGIGVFLYALSASAGDGRFWVPYQHFAQIRTEVATQDQAVAYASALPFISYGPEKIVPRVAGIKVQEPLWGWGFQRPIPTDLDASKPVTCHIHLSHNALATDRTFRWFGLLHQLKTGDLLPGVGTNTQFGNAGAGLPDREVTLSAGSHGEYIRNGPLGWPASDLDPEAELWHIVFWPTAETCGGFGTETAPAWLCEASGTGEWVYVLGMECSYGTTSGG